ncbi:hypothetical protein C8F04DRAFT_117652 [Mycena alexandri]|uniref:Uncharacterized protein n=1 Tax=Mycena alexandri TaxID=1745969 RepID=A0AAD6WVF0_9AGAR|nr:hypothetical protein C8F04DRAFT_117652 [Mycena alexandri]
MAIESNRPRTPSRSRSRSRLESEVADPLFLFSPSRPSVNDGPIEASTSAVVDEELQAASQRATAQSSPLSSPPAQKRSPPRPDSPDSPPSAQSSPSSQLHDDRDPALALALPESRYSFRRREERQQRPYKYDNAKYEKQFSHYPEALVRKHSLRRHQRRDQDYEDDQTQAFEPGNDVEERRRGRSRSPHRTERTWADDHLPALPSSDEEVDETRRAAKKLEKEKKQETKVVKRGRTKAKPFPLVNNDSVSDNAPKVCTFSHLFDLYSTQLDSLPPVIWTTS